MTEKTRVTVPMVLAVSLLASSITGTTAAVSAAYSLRDQTLQAVEDRLERAQVILRRERSESLNRYLTREQFITWRESDRIRQDANLHQVLSAIERLGSAVRRR